MEAILVIRVASSPQVSVKGADGMFEPFHFRLA